MVTELVNAEEAVAARQAQIGASWFHWIAGLTLVNVVTALFGMDWVFMLSLMAPIGAAGMAHKYHSTGGYVATALFSAFAVGLFFLLGHFGKKGARWAFVTGLTFYGLDALLWLAVREWLGLALHGYALWRIAGGLGAANRLAALRRQSAAPPWAPPQGQYAAPADADPASQQPRQSFPPARRPQVVGQPYFVGGGATLPIRCGGCATGGGTADGGATMPIVAPDGRVYGTGRGRWPV